MSSRFFWNNVFCYCCYDFSCFVFISLHFFDINVWVSIWLFKIDSHEFLHYSVLLTWQKCFFFLYFKIFFIRCEIFLEIEFIYILFAQLYRRRSFNLYYYFTYLFTYLGFSYWYVRDFKLIFTYYHMCDDCRFDMHAMYIYVRTRVLTDRY